MITAIQHNEDIFVYRTRGVCGHDLNCVSYGNLDVRLVCYSPISTNYRMAGKIPECIKCLTTVCSDLKGNKVIK